MFLHVEFEDGSTPITKNIISDKKEDLLKEIKKLSKCYTIKGNYRFGDYWAKASKKKSLLDRLKGTKN